MGRVLRQAVIAIVVIALVVLVASCSLAAVLRAERKRDAEKMELGTFYNPPAPLPAARPGDVISSEPLEAPAGVQAWRVLYHSTDRRDRDTAVSGLVVTPDRPPPPGGFPVVSVAHGTVGNARACAPSLSPFAERLYQSSFYELMVEPFTSAGYAVAATDYTGLGTPGVSPYLVGEDAGRNVLDAARMIRRLPLPALSDETVIWGHSQGGHAATFAGQIAPRYAPELRIPGVVAGSPAAELGMLAAEVGRITKPSPLTGVMVMIARAWSATYPNADAGTVLTTRGVDRMGVVDRDCIDGVMLAFLFRPARDYLTVNGLSSAPWPELIAANTPGAISTPAPILIFQGGSDPLIKPEFTQAFVQRLCAVGDTVSLNVYPSKGHLSVITPSMPDTLTWIAARLRGQPPSSNC